MEQALLSVQKAVKLIDADIFVVDNCSIDGSVEMLREKFPEVKLIANEHNVGFSKANNQAIRASEAEYVLLLNPDTIVEEDTFKKCCDFMDEHPEAGGLGVKMLDGKGVFLPESKRGLPTPEVAFYKVFGLSSIFPKSKLFGRYHLGFLGENDTNEIEILSGAYMLMRKSALDKVGLLDEDYFMYGEDIDLSYRILKGGYKNYYFPETRIIHYKGESTKKTSVNYVFIFYRAMIIFAQKHFTQNNAAAFSFLINMAIYLRAGFDISKNFIKKALLPAIDAAIIFFSMLFLKDFWAIHFKHVEDLYPETFMSRVVPAYILTWLISIYYSGGYDKPLSAFKALRGILIGTLLISGISNFLDAYRFSKALILLGATVTAIEFIGIRYLLHFIRFKNFDIQNDHPKRIVLAGKEEEILRVQSILQNANVKAVILGFVSNDSTDSKASSYIGRLDQLSAILNLHKADEVIFCSKDISANHIIELMSSISDPQIDFKIVPDDANYIIGSSSKNTNGTVYSIDIHFKLIQPGSIRSKFLLDTILSIILIAISPILIFFQKKPFNFFKNIFGVFFRKYTFVQLTDCESIKLKNIKKGVLTTTSHLNPNATSLDSSTVRHFDMIYAKDYKAVMDLGIIIKNLNRLDRVIS